MNKNVHKYNILIAPLDWGLGHTTRCLLLIKCLLPLGYTVFFAGNKTQQSIVQAQFKNNVNFLDLNGYSVKYSINRWYLPIKIAIQIPKIISRIIYEHYWLKKQIKQHHIDLVISDNRYGLFSKSIPVVFITHQLQILAPFNWMVFLIQKINYWLIQKFNLLLIPDVQESLNAAGCLSQPTKMPAIKAVYIGLLNRFMSEQENSILSSTTPNNICILISGPEPQRTILEEIFFEQTNELNHVKITVLRGLPNTIDNKTSSNLTVKYYNDLPQKELYNVLQNSDIIIARSGYTTLMEVLHLNKKLILIPTPGQTEQEYLANYLASQNIAIVASQNNLNVQELLQQANSFSPQKHTFKLFNETLFLNEIKNLLH
ncbi:MAG: glycosyltransferase [Chitinophagaceae bacterium]